MSINFNIDKQVSDKLTTSSASGPSSATGPSPDTGLSPSLEASNKAAPLTHQYAAFIEALHHLNYPLKPPSAR